MSLSRDRWLEEGLRVLAEDGVDGVRIDRIAARLGVSKGSFHHHFAGAAAYKGDLLAYFEQLSIEALGRAIAEVDGQGGAHSIMRHLTDLIERPETDLYRPELEIAVRAWSTSDAAAHAVQQRIDAARIAAIQSVWRPYVATDAEARTAALLPYLVAIGASVMSPPIGAEELGAIFEFLLPLVPESLPPPLEDGPQ